MSVVDRMARTAMFGRDTERALARAVLDNARRGDGRALIIEGDGGIGKTRLVEEVIDEASAAGFEVLAGSAEALERAHPLASVERVLGPLLTSRAGGPPGGPEVVPSIVDALIDALAKRSARRPVLICLEDLHWADEDTIAVIGSVMARVGGHHAAVVASLRPSHELPPLANVVDRAQRAGATVVHLAALDGDATKDLVRAIVGDEPGPTLMSQVARAGGHALHIVELVTALEEAGAIVRTSGEAEISDPILPPTLARTIIRRVAALPVDAVEYLRVAAVLGRRFSMADVASTTQDAVCDITARLRPAYEAAIIVDDGGRTVFRHDLVHEAIYEDIPLAARRAMHWDIATLMRCGGADATDVAPHVLAGAVAGGSESVDRLLEMVVALQGGSRRVRYELAEMALELCEQTDPRRGPCVAAWLQTLAGVTGEPHVVERGLELLRQSWPPRTEAELLAAMASAYNAIGREHEAAEMRRAAMAHPGADLEQREHYKAWLATDELSFGKVDEAERLSREVVASAMASDESIVIARSTLGFVSGARGRFTEALAQTEEFRSKGYAADSGVDELARSSALMDADRFTEAFDITVAGKRKAEAMALPPVAAQTVVDTGRLYLTGDWVGALASGQAVLDMVESVAWRRVAQALVIRIHQHRGEIARADTLLADGVDAISRFGVTVGADLLMWTNALKLERTGNRDDALTLLDLVRTHTESVPFALGAWRLIWPDLVRLAVAACRTDVARPVVDLAREVARAEGEVGTVGAAALRIEGLFAQDAEMLAAAADRFASSSRAIESAAAAEDAGRTLLGADRDRGVGYLTRSHDAWTALGANADADRVRAALRGAGLNVGVRGARNRATTGWDALTTAELRMVALVARGFTNGAIAEQLYISDRTVQAHLRNVFRKLGVSSRAEVAVAATRRG